jgi:2-polyprenyl-3-methyl-5-hydroxy-6-metoxy-1,4-benzoquinol methylase
MGLRMQLARLQTRRHFLQTCQTGDPFDSISSGFDAIVSLEVIEHLPDRALFARNVFDAAAA